MADVASDALGWAEKNPVATGAIVLVAGLGVLWWLGYFSGTSSSGSGTSLADAYYASEAASAASGAQTQQIQIQANAATAIAGINANSAVKINTSNNAATLGIARSSDAADVQKATIAGNVATVQSNNDLNAANTATVYGTNVALAKTASDTEIARITGQTSSNAAFYSAQSSELASNNDLVSKLFGLLIPAEATNPGQVVQAPIGGVNQTIGLSGGASSFPSPAGYLASIGYSPSQIGKLAG